MSDVMEKVQPDPMGLDIESMVPAILKEAADMGASTAEVMVSTGSGLSVSARMGDVETVEFNRDKGMGITVYFGNRKGSASTSDFSVAAIKDAVRRPAILPVLPQRMTVMVWQRRNYWLPTSLSWIYVIPGRYPLSRL